MRFSRISDHSNKNLAKPSCGEYVSSRPIEGSPGIPADPRPVDPRDDRLIWPFKQRVPGSRFPLATGDRLPICECDLEAKPAARRSDELSATRRPPLMPSFALPLVSGRNPAAAGFCHDRRVSLNGAGGTGAPAPLCVH
jgi:hypothetical protein